MRDGVGAGLPGDVDQVLGDQRAGNRGAEQVDAFIDGIGAEHREDEIAHEFFAHVLDEDFLDAQHFRLLAGRFKFFALAEIGGKGHDFRAQFRLKPLQDDRGVEAARIGENDFLNVFPLAHNSLPSDAVAVGAELQQIYPQVFYQLPSRVQADELRLIAKTHAYYVIFGSPTS